ncbi:MAG TPA: hypothetical protein VNM14_19815 [Planctomycetota bacterium]|nr:hypothetical protein [Planctomycetota bacterium]
MKLLLSAPPRRTTPAEQLALKGARRMSVVFGSLGLVLVVLGVAAKAPIPFCIWGFFVLGAAVVVRRSGERRLELWLHGTEMLAEARPGKAWTLTWSVDGKTFRGQTSQMPLLWTNGRVRILVDLDKPSRMIPLGLEMVETPEAEGPQTVLPPVLPPRPRRASLLVLTEARQRRNAALLTASLALFVACLVSPFVLERCRFLAEAVPAGQARVTGRTRSSVEYVFDGARRSFEAGGKSQVQWPVGKIVTVYRHRGFVVAEPEVPGMRIPVGVILIVAPIVAAILILTSAVGEARQAQRLWRFGKEVPAEMISDHTQNQRREVICRFSSAGLGGVTRREFAASRNLLEGYRGEPVVLVDPRDPKVSRMMLADEA